MSSQVETFIREFIEKKGPIPDGIDAGGFDYINSGHVDSMRLMRFIVELESRFDIDIADEDIEQPEFRTVGGVVRIVENKMDRH